MRHVFGWLLLALVWFLAAQASVQLYRRVIGRVLFTAGATGVAWWWINELGGLR